MKSTSSQRTDGVALLQVRPRMGQRGYGAMLLKDLLRNRYVYLMAIPVIVFYITFYYVPMYGLVISFQRYSPGRGIAGSPWVGFQYFQQFFSSFYFVRLIRNTITISVLNLIWGFPAPIILALLLNEIRSGAFKRTVQSLTYLPHFISLVVVAGLILNFSASRGFFNDLIAMAGGTRIAFFQDPRYFRPIYIASEIWQQAGWGSIIYLAALSAIDPELYEAATIDGAGRFRKLISITLPSIIPTIVVLLILRMGQMMNVGFEKIILLYNPAIYETADVIASFVYRKGLQEFAWSYATAVGLFNSVINLMLIVTANAISRRVNDTSLW